MLLSLFDLNWVTFVEEKNYLKMMLTLGNCKYQANL